MNGEAKTNVRDAAAAVRSARRSLIACAPVKLRFGLETLSEAYEAQEINTAAYLAEGRRLSGRKIGLTSKSVQQQMGVDHPDFGMLFSDMEFPTGAVVDTACLLQPRVEAEIAFVLERDLTDPYMTASQLVRAVAFALPAIEVVDSAIADWKIGLLDTVVDNASSGVYVLGDSPRTLTQFDLELCGMLMECNGSTVSVGTGAACLGNPINAALWLARKMVEVGRPLVAGDIILSGALGPMVKVTAGDAVSVRIGGLGQVQCRFSIQDARQT